MGMSELEELADIIQQNDVVDDDCLELTLEFVEKISSNCRPFRRRFSGSLHDAPGKVAKEDMMKVEGSLYISPSFLDVVPRRKRSERVKRGLSRQRWKIDDFTFDDHLEKIWGSLSEDKRSLFAQVNSICFSLYKRERSKGLSLIKKKDIFSKEYVFVPIVCWDHWRLVIFCHFGEAADSNARTRCILLLDSVETGAREIEPDVRKFVFDIFKSEGRPETKGVIYQIPFLVPKVPQEENDVDCGRYVLYFIKEFVDAAPVNFSFSNGYPYFMNPEWFVPEKFNDFCDKLDQRAPPRAVDTCAHQRRSSQRIRKTRASSRRDSEVVVID